MKISSEQQRVYSKGKNITGLCRSPGKCSGDWHKFVKQFGKEPDKSIRRIFDEPHGGGSSLSSEAMSVVILLRKYEKKFKGSKVRLYSTEIKARSIYKSATNARPINYVLSVFGAKRHQLIFVSVVRCFRNPDFKINELMQRKIKALEKIDVKETRKKKVSRNVKGRRRGKKHKKIKKKDYA